MRKWSVSFLLALLAGMIFLFALFAVSQRLFPDAILSSAEYSSIALSDIDEDVNSNDGSWGIWDGNGNTSVCVSFPTPANTLTVGSNLQFIEVRARKSASGGVNPVFNIEIYESGVLKSTGIVNFELTDSDVNPGIINDKPWNASILSDLSGVGVETCVIQISGGTGGSRRGVEVGAINWVAEHDPLPTPTPTPTATPTVTPTPTLTPTPTPTVVPLNFGFLTKTSEIFENDGMHGSNHVFSRNFSFGIVEYQSGFGVTTNSFFLFPNMEIPKNVQIIEAHIRFHATTSVGSGWETIFYGEKTANPQSIISDADYHSRTFTTASVTWNPPSWIVNGIYTSPDLSTILQELIDLPGWEYRNNMQFFWNDNQSVPTDKSLIFGSSDSNSMYEPRLDVVYLESQVEGGGFLNMNEIAVYVFLFLGFLGFGLFRHIPPLTILSIVPFIFIMMELDTFYMWVGGVLTIGAILFIGGSQFTSAKDDQ